MDDKADQDGANHHAWSSWPLGINSTQIFKFRKYSSSISNLSITLAILILILAPLLLHYQWHLRSNRHAWPYEACLRDVELLNFQGSAVLTMDRSILRSFKLKGLSLSGDASRALSRVLSIEEDPTGSLERILDEIKERIEKREINSSLIDVDAITSVVAYLSSSEEDLQQESTQLFDAFNSPKIEYDERTKTFRVEPKPTYRLHGSVDSRARMFRERLLFTQQRLLRSGIVVTRTMGQSHSDTSSVSNNRRELSTIESLLGSTGTKILFGMLTQVGTFPALFKLQIRHLRLCKPT